MNTLLIWSLATMLLCAMFLLAGAPWAWWS